MDRHVLGSGPRRAGWVLFLELLLIALAGSLAGCGSEGDVAHSLADEDAIPSFRVDADWPILPGHWVTASGIGLWVDETDHVWFSHRAELATDEYLEAAAEPPGVPAPLVMEFDPSGVLVQTWGSHDEAEGWPAVLHGLFVDHNGYVWSAARDQHQVMKFTRDGAVILALGRYAESGGSHDPDRFARPADIYVDPETNELFVADGYDNRRVAVFDAETGAFLRQWGAYGEPPDDEWEPSSSGTVGEPPGQFNLLHAITGSRDGLIYVADQTNSRIQVFERSGRFVAERILRPGIGAATALAFSPDPEQRLLYVADGREDRIYILRRQDLEVLGSFGEPGPEPGRFGRPHNLATDSRGNVYVGEAHPGRRLQRFVPEECAPSG